MVLAHGLPVVIEVVAESMTPMIERGAKVKVEPATEEIQPGDIVFTKVQTLPAPRLYTLVVDAQTNNPPQIPVYESTLKSSPLIEAAEARMGPTNGNTATFTLTVTFKPETIKPEPAPSA